jgi:hypothetical protein
LLSYLKLDFISLLKAAPFLVPLLTKIFRVIETLEKGGHFIFLVLLLDCRLFGDKEELPSDPGVIVVDIVEVGSIVVIQRIVIFVADVMKNASC